MRSGFQPLQVLNQQIAASLLNQAISPQRIPCPADGFRRQFQDFANFLAGKGQRQGERLWGDLLSRRDQRHQERCQPHSRVLEAHSRHLRSDFGDLANQEANHIERNIGVGPQEREKLFTRNSANFGISKDHGGQWISCVFQRFQAKKFSGKKNSSDPLLPVFKRLDQLDQTDIQREKVMSRSAFKKQNLISVVLGRTKNTRKTLEMFA